jgi:hypothetical protein
MTEKGKVVPMWMGVVEGAVGKFKAASSEEQEIICVGLGDEYGAEAAEKAREMFRARRAVAEVVEKIQAKEKAKIEVVREEEEPIRKPVGSRLGIAPGLVGEITDFTLDSAMYPSVGFAVGGSLLLVGTLIGRRIAGPSGPLGTGTHLYLVLVGPTGSGKEHVRTVTKLLLSTVGAAALIGPGRFKSGAAIISHLVKKPLSLCVMDEFGAMLARFSHPNAQFYHQDGN